MDASLVPVGSGSQDEYATSGSENKMQ